MRLEMFRIGNIPIYSYGLMIAIGLLLALFVGQYRFKKHKLDDEIVFDLILICAISGFLGAKLLYVIVEFKDFMENPMQVLGSAGFVVYGGIITGVLAGYIYTRVKKLNFMEVFDCVMPEVALVQAFGRIGCFLAGCCYGRKTDSFLGVVFPEGSLAPPGVKLLPTQLFSSAGDLIIAVLLMVLADCVYKNVKKQSSKKFGHVYGDIGCTYMLLYGVGRFLIEFLRNDVRGEVGILSTSQFISIFIVALGIGLMIFNRKKIAVSKENENDNSKEAAE